MRLPTVPVIRPIVHVTQMGNIANKMIQYMAARRIAQDVEHCQLSNIEIPEWGISFPNLFPFGGFDLELTQQDLNSQSVIDRLRSGQISKVNINSYCQHISNYPDRDLCQTLFVANHEQYPGFDDHYMVFNLRGGEVLDGRHPDYTLIPIEFYQDIIRNTGLIPVFLGQMEDNIYWDDLRKAFPGARFHSSRGAIHDFQVFRNSRNICLAISTFSWLAGWLSNAHKVILPVNGLFHPMQSKRTNFLPLEEPRFEPYLFPINYATPVADYRPAHAAIGRSWRLLQAEMLFALRDNRPRYPRTYARYVQRFSEDYYVSLFKDVAGEVLKGTISRGAEHYLQHGFHENRNCFPFDEQWYSRTYPLAAFEVGQGDFLDLRHHFVEIGFHRGYKPAPERASAETSTSSP
jgi:hypothetical protein